MNGLFSKGKIKFFVFKDILKNFFPKKDYLVPFASWVNKNY